jgi:hypothetical protein
MSPGNTRTGGVLEQIVLPALDHGGYKYETQVQLGERLGCGKHFVDAVVTKDGRQFLLSVKWQQVSGTAEQKVPFEVICLIDALERSPYERAYVVLGGEGWKLRDFYTKGGLSKYLANSERVEIMTLESFIGRANSGKL